MTFEDTTIIANYLVTTTHQDIVLDRVPKKLNPLKFQPIALCQTSLSLKFNKG